MVSGSHPSEAALRRCHARVLNQVGHILQHAQSAEMSLMPPACTPAQAEVFHHTLGRGVSTELLFAMILETIRCESVDAGRDAVAQVRRACDEFEKRIDALVKPKLTLVSDDFTTQEAPLDLQEGPSDEPPAPSSTTT